MVFYQRGRHVIFDPSASGVGEAPLELLLDVVKVFLLKTSYSINVTTHEQFDDVASSEIVATSYNSRGNALASKAIARDDGNTRVELDAADTVFSAVGGTTDDTFDAIGLLREQTSSPTDANSELLAHTAVNSTTTNGGDITMVWNTEGILHLA